MSIYFKNEHMLYFYNEKKPYVLSQGCAFWYYW